MRPKCHASEPKKFWGTSDVQAVRESVVELNRALSQLSMILELSGNPECTDYERCRCSELSVLRQRSELRSCSACRLVALFNRVFNLNVAFGTADFKSADCRLLASINVHSRQDSESEWPRSVANVHQCAPTLLSALLSRVMQRPACPFPKRTGREHAQLVLPELRLL